MNNDILTAFKASDLVDKNINFLIGSGASAGYIPTLWVKDDITYEDILTNKKYQEIENVIYHFYYDDILSKSFCISPSDLKEKLKFKKTFINYLRFIKNLSSLIDKKSANQIRRANIFTTNYDLFLEKSSDLLLKTNTGFIFNDGGRGLHTRHLNISNFHTSTWHQGTNDLYKFEIPTINLIKMHGSISWKKVNEDTISIRYLDNLPDELSIETDHYLDIKETIEKVDELIYFDGAKNAIELSREDEEKLQRFRNEYDKLAIVNPTKAKFEETVFQQHYYQSLRLLSYELEKPQTILICFGFSFKDEHIREIIQRSLSNPSLIIYIFCYRLKDKESIKKIISSKKIIFISPNSYTDENNIDFKRFISCIFPRNNEYSLRGLTCNL
ncbi:SIR2 family protein [Dickeya oryzae]|uniref:SIR2 family protein n=1 Tax=Dickeya oryzae TaxID=1240404 RepID=UPI00057695FE|nr:SIR2 family protein [Dickeya oryzae]